MTGLRRGKYDLQDIEIISPNGNREKLRDFDELQYTETLFEGPFTFGSISISDTSDVVRTMPIVGGERIIFSYKITDETETITKTFITIGVTTKNNDPMASKKNHQISFVSEELFHDRNVIISRSFKNKSAQEIVGELFSNISQSTKSKLNIGKTKGNHHFIIPNIHPSEAISLVCRYTRHPSYESSAFYFFQNSYGYNFVCLEELFERKSLGEFAQNVATAPGDVIKEFSLKSLVSKSDTIDRLKVMGGGMFGSRYVSYDPLVKMYQIKEYDYFKGGFEKTKHLNKFPIAVKKDWFMSTDQRVSYVTSNSLREKSKYIENKKFDLSHSNFGEQFFAEKTSLFEQLHSKVYEIELSGDDVPSLGESKPRPFTVGEVMEIEAYAQTKVEDNKGQSHNTKSGKYLITKCTHRFNAESYEIYAEIMSDSNAMPYER